MFLFDCIADIEWQQIKSAKKIYSYVKESKTKEYLELDDSLQQPVDSSCSTKWLFIATPLLEVACTDGQRIEMIPLKKDIKELFFSTLKKNFESNEASWECSVVETAVAVFIQYYEQCVEQYYLAGKDYELPGYSKVKQIRSMIEDVLQIEKELGNMRQTLVGVRSRLCTFEAASRSETLVQWLYERNGMNSCLFSCLQRVQWFESRVEMLKRRTDRVLQVDIAGVFFSAVFSGVLMIPAFFAFNMLIPIEHLRNGSTYFFIAVVILCFVAIAVLAILYVRWLKGNERMRLELLLGKEKTATITGTVNS
ncbi:hypothetical protein GAYE_SCF54G6253 [Galdieria yellowstonensis]|uniref:Magnesium transporter n=1 Tax=Galdieria yellowstonensis TaxID=3028027 RepID=A0AAV9IMF3_9RHOD|nr:hypothetical protein GAYE_SCF54G6253 [Galdieria yellowstonensis]